MEERYVQYLEKAKMILRQMDPRNTNSISNQEIQSLRKQLDEKDRKLKDLDVEYEKMKAIKDDQEKLLISAWYSLVRLKHQINHIRNVCISRVVHFNDVNLKND
jgi:hypothetical protein